MTSHILGNHGGIAADKYGHRRYAVTSVNLCELIDCASVEGAVNPPPRGGCFVNGTRGSSTIPASDRRMPPTGGFGRESQRFLSPREDSDSGSAGKVVDSDGDDEKRPNRYKPRDASALLTQWDFAVIRSEIQ
jgi:hypothetical protein